MNLIKECPNCSKKLRFPDNKFIKFNCPECEILLFVDNGDFVSEPEEVEEIYEKKHPKMMNYYLNMEQNKNGKKKRVNVFFGKVFGKTFGTTIRA